MIQNESRTMKEVERKPIEGEAVDNNCIDEKGPFRPYARYNAFALLKIGAIRHTDILISILLPVGYYLYMLQSYDISVMEPVANEKKLLTYINAYKSRIFYLTVIGPFSIQFYSLFSMDYVILRRVSLSFCSSILGILYLTLRRINVFPMIAILGACSIACTEIFQSYSMLITEYPINWFLTSLVIYSWRSVKVSTPMSKKWCLHMLLMSISLGLAMSTKHISFATYAWIILISINEFWNFISDVSLSGRSILKISLVNLLILSVIPTATFISSYLLLINNFENDNNSVSKYMSLEFQTYLRGDIAFTENLYYGSIIKLRHIESLGGYLHSEDTKYPNDSEEQMVSLSDEEADPNNEWVIEHRYPEFDYFNRSVVVTNFDEIRLRHRLTGKLLRASSAKPPVSEEDYTSEISCTGDENYKGDTDELWKVQVHGNPEKVPISLPQSILQFTNSGHGCSMISHATRLPTWGSNNQEVLCIDPPNYTRTMFKINSINYSNQKDVNYIKYLGESSRKWLPFKLSLLFELLTKQIKYNDNILHFETESIESAFDWPFAINGFSISETIWISSIVAIIIFITILSCSILLWNPWYPKSSNLNPVATISNEFKVELLVAWLFHYAPMIKNSNNDIKIVQYFHSFFVGELICFVLLNDLYNWKRIMIILPLSYVIYSIYSVFL